MPASTQPELIGSLALEANVVAHAVAPLVDVAGRPAAPLFNWQRGYDFVEPREIAAGTRLIHRTVYDNSSRNPGNPDPTRTVVWGLQSHQEMLYDDFVFSWVDERSDAPLHDHGHTEAVQWVGYTDRDMSGGVSMDEIPLRLRERFAPAFEAGDENADGELSADEYYVAEREMMQRRTERQDSAGD